MPIQHLARQVIFLSVDPLTLALQNLGIARMNAGDTNTRHKHLFMEIHYCKQGSVALRLGKRVVRIMENQAYFINSGIYHTQDFLRSSTLYYFSLFITENEPAAAAGKKTIPLQSIAGLLNSPYGIVTATPSLAQNFECLFDASGGDVTRFTRAAETMIMEFADLLGKKAARYPGSTARALAPADKKTRQLIAAATASLKKNYLRTISMRALAQQACLSQRQFERIFKQVTDCTPTQYLMDLRLQKAVKLIKTTDMKINAVLEASGFKNRGLFFKLFTKRMGTSPEHFRRTLA